MHTDGNDKRCKSPCPVDMYGDDSNGERVCRACHANCLTCFGGENSHCNTCMAGLSLLVSDPSVD
jgi:hypothetical protein